MLGEVEGVMVLLLHPIYRDIGTDRRDNANGRIIDLFCTDPKIIPIDYYEPKLYIHFYTSVHRGFLL